MNSQFVWVRGENLWHTLLLNTTKYDGVNGDPFPFSADKDLPAWERPACPPSERMIAGPVDALTYMWRRVRLVWQGDQVVAIALTKGHSLPESISAVGFEWALPTIHDTEPKTGVTTRRALRASLERRVWRDVPALLQASRRDDTRGNRRHQAPPLLEWLALLHLEGERVPPRLRVEVAATVADQAKPMGWFTQALTLPLSYLEDDRLWGRIQEALALAERHEECLRTFKGSPYQVLGEALKLDAKALAAFDGRTRYWAALERPFLTLLDTLPDDLTLDEIGEPLYGQATLQAWERDVQATAQSAFEASIEGIRDYRARALGMRRLFDRLNALKAAEIQSLAAPTA